MRAGACPNSSPLYAANAYNASMNRWIAALPMYNVTPQHAELWRSFLADALTLFAHAGGPRQVRLAEEPYGDLSRLWRRKDLLLSQTCGFPYRVLRLHEAVHLVATPVFDAEGCDGPRYRSAFVVSRSAWQRGAKTLPECFELRAVCNSADSHSGMNALRHAAAAYALEGRFFSSVLWSGSHLESLGALVDARADIAAIDCVTLALLRDSHPGVLDGLHVIGMSESAPGLPFIASKTLDQEHLPALRDALGKAVEIDPRRAQALRLRGVAALAAEDYADIEQMANEAALLGYPELH